MKISAYRNTVEHDGVTYKIVGRGNEFERLPEVGDKNRAEQTVEKVFRVDSVADDSRGLLIAYDLYLVTYDDGDEARLAVDVSGELETEKE